MNVLIVGNGKGSWIMRGQQLGAAIGARVTSSPTDADFKWADRVVLIKKHATTFAHRAHRYGKPIIWDALDFWSQPAHNSYREEAALVTLKAHIDVIRPSLVIGATEAMARAAQRFCPAAYLPHHSWAGLAPTPPRESVQVVAYEGNALYLGRWHGWLLEACQKRGWTFVVNPSRLSIADIVVAFRDEQWDGWLCREWKSGVKVVNAIAAGRPLISQGSAARRELPTTGATVESLTDLDHALDVCASPLNRGIWFDHNANRAPLLTLDVIAKRYTEILATVEVSCATA